MPPGVIMFTTAEVIITALVTVAIILLLRR
jgi:hypothetical protein